jgi:hypothetical protein
MEMASSLVQTDVVGKLFRVECCAMRRCMVCEKVFNRDEARQHSTVPCFPVASRTEQRATEDDGN